MVELGRLLGAPNGTMNRIAGGDGAAHDWYRFVLSYPPHLVRHYLERFPLTDHARILDPFCGTGTTLVESKKLGLAPIGIEAHPMTRFASSVKTDWTPDPADLLVHATTLAELARDRLAAQGIDDSVLIDRDDRQDYRVLPPESAALLLRNSISPRPLHKVLVLRELLSEQLDARFIAHERLALATALVETISNLHFGPEVGVGSIAVDAPVIEPWLAVIRGMCDDLGSLRSSGLDPVPAEVEQADARAVGGLLPDASIDVVVCSPPYPNEKDYTRTTRLESVLLGFITTKAELRLIKQGLVRSNTRTVYRGDDDDQHIAAHPEVERIASEIEERRIALGKTSGFERMYPRVTRLYFGGMAKHLAGLRPLLRPGAHLAYVVGDQASFLRVMIRTGQLLADIAERLGYEVVDIDLFRTRLATATREQLREEVVVLRWPGPDRHHRP